MGFAQGGQPAVATRRQLAQLRQFGAVGSNAQQRFHRWHIGTGQAIEAGDLLQQAEQCAVQVEQRRLALGLGTTRGIQYGALLGFTQRLDGETGEVELLVGSGIAFLGHDGALR